MGSSIEQLAHASGSGLHLDARVGFIWEDGKVVLLGGRIMNQFPLLSGRSLLNSFLGVEEQLLTKLKYVHIKSLLIFRRAARWFPI